MFFLRMPCFLQFCWPFRSFAQFKSYFATYGPCPVNNQLPNFAPKPKFCALPISFQCVTRKTVFCRVFAIFFKVCRVFPLFCRDFLLSLVMRFILFHLVLTMIMMVIDNDGGGEELTFAVIILVLHVPLLSPGTFWT